MGGKGGNLGPTLDEVAKRHDPAWIVAHYAGDLNRTTNDALQPHEAALLHLDCRKSRTRLGWRPVWDSATTFELGLIWRWGVPIDLYRHWTMRRMGD